MDYVDGFAIVLMTWVFMIILGAFCHWVLGKPDKGEGA
jgi:hypothetical protein